MIVPLALTMGDPAGIGGEITLRAWQALRGKILPFFVIDDPVRLENLAARMGMTVPIETISDPSQAVGVFAQALPVLPVGRTVPAHLGQPDPAHAPAVTASIGMAVHLAMSGAVSGVITNPISKRILYKSGFRYPGHTEWLQALTNAPHAIMMLACPELRAIPVTVHMPLSQVIRDLNTDAIVTAGKVAAQALKQDFGIANPRLAVAGLNPHAGEGGALGEEDERIVMPAVQALQQAGLQVIGPMSPDSMFSPSARGRYDVAICMYHDQALIPVKALDMDAGVNITLGLPIVRTSPDHGTAFDIAERLRADPGSLIAAISQAARMAATRSQR